MRLAISGGAGFIGSNLAKHFMDKNEVLVIDKFRNNQVFSNNNLKSFGHFKNLIGFEGELYCGDICDEKTLKKIKEFRPDVIFHEAAISDTTVMEQDEVMRVNLNSFKDILDLARDFNAKVIYASSGAVYGNAPSPQVVNKNENPSNVYGFTKLMMDKMAMKFHEEFGLHIVGLRYFNVYGDSEFFKNKTASMVLQFGLQMLSSGSVRLFVGSERIFRDFVYIKDVILANELAINGPSGVYNVGSGLCRSFEEIVDILQDKLGLECAKEYIKNPFSKQYQFHTKADIASTQKYLKYEPKWSLEAGIEDYLPAIKRIFKEELNA